MVEHLLPPGRRDVDPVIGNDCVRCITKRLQGFVASEIPGGDVERFKEAFLDLLEEFQFTGREHRLDDTVGVFARRAVVGYPDIGIRLVHRVEFNLLQSRRRSHREIDERTVERRVVFLDRLRGLRKMEFREEPESGLRSLVGRSRLCRSRSKRGGGKGSGEEVVELRYDPGVIDEIKMVLVASEVQFLDRKRGTLRKDQVCQVPEVVDRHHPDRKVFVRSGLIDGRRTGVLPVGGVGRIGILKPPHSVEYAGASIAPGGRERRSRPGPGISCRPGRRNCGLFCNTRLLPLNSLQERSDQIFAAARTPAPGGRGRSLLRFAGSRSGTHRNRLLLCRLPVGWRRRYRFVRPRREFSAVNPRHSVLIAGHRFPGLREKIPDCCYQFTFFILIRSHPLCPQYQRTILPEVHGIQ